jgi:phage recombination protein Bet
MSKVSTFPSAEQGKAVSPTADQKIPKETIYEYLKVFGFDKTLSESEIQQFVQVALAGNLDPFKREIYIAVYGEGENRKVSILTGYQVYLKRAERTGNLDGWRAWLEGSGAQMKALVEIFRKDWSHSFTHEVYWEEAVQKKKDGNPTQFWAKQPRFQLRKVAMAQAFRLAFPDELGGLPYESAELPDSENTPVNQTLPTDTRPVKTSNRDSGTDLAGQALGGEQPPAETEGNTPEKAEAPASDTAAPSNKPQDTDNEDEYLEDIIRRVEGLFEAHPKDFTAKHQAWILDKIYKAADKAGIQKMLAYAEKVIRKTA